MALSAHNEICLWGRWNSALKTKMVLFFKSIFHYQFVEHRYIFLVKWDYPGLWAFYSPFNFVFFKKILKSLILFSFFCFLQILYFHNFQRAFEVFNVIFQLLYMSPLLPPLCITKCIIVRNFFRYSISNLIFNIYQKTFSHLTE